MKEDQRSVLRNNQLEKETKKKKKKKKKSGVK
jgi:hypothetical protein